MYLHRDFVDFRKSINGLAAIVETDMALPTMSGALFVFCNKGRDKLKILYWDRTGFALWYKRLEKDKFKWPGKFSMPPYSLSEQQLDWLLSGYDVIGHQPMIFQSLPEDSRKLQEMVLALQSQIQVLQQENKHLLEQFRLAQQKQLGASSESHPGQGELFNEVESEADLVEEECETQAISYTRKTPKL